MTFGEALEAMKVGDLVSRSAWKIQPRETWLRVIDYERNEPYIAMIIRGSQTLRVVSDLPPFVERGNDRHPDIVPWVPSQQDMLVNDWFVLEFGKGIAA